MQPRYHLQCLSPSGSSRKQVTDKPDKPMKIVKCLSNCCRLNPTRRVMDELYFSLVPWKQVTLHGHATGHTPSPLPGQDCHRGGHTGRRGRRGIGTYVAITANIEGFVRARLRATTPFVLMEKERPFGEISKLLDVKLVMHLSTSTALVQCWQLI